METQRNETRKLFDLHLLSLYKANSKIHQNYISRNDNIELFAMLQNFNHLCD
jgi:hypothetical protein